MEPESERWTQTRTSRTTERTKMEQKLTMSHVQRRLERYRETVLKYEKRGWLISERTESGIRLFERQQVEALRDRLQANSRPR
jgi:hypothetical protein